MTFRFLHSGDLHLGKRFGNLPEDLRGRLREARHAVIGRLAEIALKSGASIVLLAGDTFDTETPSSSVLRQALSVMASHATLRWVLLPGNHDSLLAEELWNAIRANLPPNVTLASETAPLPLESGFVLLPAPCNVRRPGRDLTDWMDGAVTPEGSLRVGLAHGPVQTFSEEATGANIIAPDRAARAGLDYLALGDWHGSMRIGERTWYSGTPEPDRFKHSAPGRALLVTVDGPGAPPQVDLMETGSFEWRTAELALLDRDDASAMLASLLPAAPLRRQTLLRILASGRLRVTSRTALDAAFSAVGPEFALAELEVTGLATIVENADLDLIDRAGALRRAAEALLAESRDEQRARAEREVASEALVRLFCYYEAAQQR
ncbi:DNA repair exonuclease [Xanthobacter sp. DSM 24535]|uniref:metallophosphoesterase family protein n=1 Tax=Roseixanthobacter psychrophilus TaxID=3119917 RepID=UPI00372853CD